MSSPPTSVQIKRGIYVLAAVLAVLYATGSLLQLKHVADLDKMPLLAESLGLSKDAFNESRRQMTSDASKAAMYSVILDLFIALTVGFGVMGSLWRHVNERMLPKSRPVHNLPLPVPKTPLGLQSGPVHIVLDNFAVYCAIYPYACNSRQPFSRVFSTGLLSLALRAYSAFSSDLLLWNWPTYREQYWGSWCAGRNSCVSNSRLPIILRDLAKVQARHRVCAPLHPGLLNRNQRPGTFTIFVFYLRFYARKPAGAL